MFKIYLLYYHLLAPIHVIQSHFDFFPENLGAVSEHGERFHQNIAEIEKRYQGKWSMNALAGYCWSLVTNETNAHHHRVPSRSSCLLFALATLSI